MMPENDHSQIARRQCELTARTYYAFRQKGDPHNDLIEIPAMKAKQTTDLVNAEELRILLTGFRTAYFGAEHIEHERPHE
jgi:hypothetical protein